jgi:hypothetical protein
MIRKLLLFITLLSWGYMTHAQNSLAVGNGPINVFNSTKYAQEVCYSQDAVGYLTEDGLFYCNYSRTTKLSSRNYVRDIQMTEKYLLWMDNDANGIISIYLFDGTITRKLNTSSVYSHVLISPAYYLWVENVWGNGQVFRYNRSTGVVTQMTNESAGCSDLRITDPQASTFSFIYTTPNSLNGKKNIISCTPANSRRLVYDAYPGTRIVLAGGNIFFTDIVNGSSQVFKSNVNTTGAYQFSFFTVNTYPVAGSDKYIAISHAGIYGLITEVSDAESNGNSYLYYITSPGDLKEPRFVQDKFVWVQNDGNDDEIMYHDGKMVRQITNNNENDHYLNITDSGDLIYFSNDSGKSISRYYNFAAGTISEIELGSPYINQVQGSNILTLEYRNGIYQCFLYTHSPYKLSSLDFRCDETSKNGTAFISIERPLRKGLIGLDFKVTFDPSAVSVGSVDVVNPTDANGNTAVLTYTISGNTISISYYLRSAAPGTSIIAKGPILGISLLRNATTTYTSNYSVLKVVEVVESNALGIVKGPLPIPASYNISTETYAGLLLYGAISGRPMAHSAANPAVVYQSDYACVQQPLTSAVVNPGSTGIFRINKNIVNTQLQFVKDLPGSYNTGCSSSNIMTFMNGSDWALAADISKGNVSAVTSPLQYIAADVNMDGNVSAGDAALISSRAVLKICEYPQVWNYVLQDGYPVPGPNYKPSKDFVFIHESMFTATASKNAVPLVTDCLPMPAAQNCPASDALATKYAGILLGDVNLSYWPTNVLTRIGMTNDVVFTSTEVPEIVNVSGTCAERLKALDFRIVLPEGTRIEDVVPAHPDVNVNWNTVDSLLLVTSYVDGDSSAPDKLFNIILKNGLLNNLSTGDFYINGEPAGFANRIVNGTTDLAKRQVKILPNPTAGRFTLEFREGISGWITVNDMEGKVVSRTFADATSHELNIEEAPAGVYFVKVESDNTSEVYKVVKQ